MQLEDIFKGKRRGRFNKVFLYLHDNVPAHRALATQNQLVNLSIQCLHHPPYSPDPATTDHHPLMV